MTLSDQPFSNLRNLLNEKNHVQPPRHGTAVVETHNAGIDRKAAQKMNQIANVSDPGFHPSNEKMEADRVAFGERIVQESIPFGSHSKEEEK